MNNKNTKKSNRKNKNVTSENPETAKNREPAADASALGPDPSAFPSVPAPRSRNGKIARLPIEVRCLLNRRLDDGQDGPTVLDWLNALPETRAVLDQSFAGVPVSLQNLSQWRQGGYVQWQTECNIDAHCQSLRDFAEGMEECGPDYGHVADDLVTVLSAKYAQLVSAACGLDGGVTPDWEKRLQALHPLLRDAIQLQRAMQRAVDHQMALGKMDKAETAAAEDKIRRIEAAVDARKIFGEMMQNLKLGQELAQREEEEEEEDEDVEPEVKHSPTIALLDKSLARYGSKPIKPNQSQSNPETAATVQSAATPKPAASTPLESTQSPESAQAPEETPKASATESAAPAESAEPSKGGNYGMNETHGTDAAERPGGGA